MNGLPGAVSGLARSNGGNSGGVEHRSPVTSPPGFNKAGGDKGRKRTHEVAGLDSSPGSGVGEGEGNDERRKPGVKRACNECRQQKVFNTSGHQQSFGSRKLQENTLTNESKASM